jgi:hypothetical protein
VTRVCRCCSVELEVTWSGSLDRERGGCLSSTARRRGFDSAVRFAATDNDEDELVASKDLLPS